MTKIAKKTKRYPSDLADEEWEQIAPLMPKPGRRGRRREVDFSDVINAGATLCARLRLADAADPFRRATAYGWFRELARRFVFQMWR